MVLILRDRFNALALQRSHSVVPVADACHPWTTS